MIGFLPWSPWLVRWGWRLRSSGRLAPIDRYLATGIAGVFVVFTLIRTKLPHYTLPAFPLIALWLGKMIAERPECHRQFRRFTAVTLSVLLLVALPGSWVFSQWLPVPRLARELRPWTQTSTELASLEFQEPSLYWYLRPTGGPWIRHLQDEASAREFLGRPGSRICVLPDGEVCRRLTATFPELKSVGAGGFNPANGKRVELRALVRLAP
jgi:hypothetical protein